MATQAPCLLRTVSAKQALFGIPPWHASPWEVPCRCRRRVASLAMVDDIGPRIVDIPRRLPRSWPLFDHSLDAWALAQDAVHALLPADGQGVPWALVFLLLLLLAGLYEVAVFIVDMAMGDGMGEKELLEQEAALRRREALNDAEDAEAAAAQDRQRRLRLGQRMILLRKAKQAALRAEAARQGAPVAGEAPDPRVPVGDRLAEERFLLRDFVISERWRGIAWLAACTAFACWVTGALDKDNPLMP